MRRCASGRATSWRRSWRTAARPPISPRPVSPQRPRGRAAVTRAVVFAYSEVGVRCVRELLGAGDRDSAAVHARGRSRRESVVRQRAAAGGGARASRVVTPDSPNTPRVDRGGGAPRSPILCSRSTIATCSTRRGSTSRARGALNMHGSLLPKYRGRAPVHWAILNGETATGASLHYMVEKPDAGALVDQQSVPILENDNALDVSLKVAAAAAAGAAPQPAGADRRARAARGRWISTQGSYFGRRRPEDGRIDWRQAARARCTIWCARWRRRFRAPLPRSTGVGLPFCETRMDAEPARHPGACALPVCRGRAAGMPTASTAGGLRFCNWR